MKKKSFVFLGSGLFFLLLVSGFFIIRSNKSKITTIGFYDVPSEVQTALQQTLTKEIPDLKFKTLSEKDVLDNKLNKNIEILISYNNAIIQKHKKKAETLTSSTAENYGNAIKKSKLYTENDKLVLQPVLLDMFEAIVTKNTYVYRNIPLPGVFSQIRTFAKQAQEFYPIPIVISGADDINVNSLFSVMVDAYGGKNAYFEMADKLSETTDFEAIYDYKIGGDAPDDFSIKSLLDILILWQNANLLDPVWYNRTEEKTSTFFEDAVPAMSFMNMSEHRLKPLPNIKYFSTMEIPSEYAQSRVSIQPAIVAMYFNNKDTALKIQKILSTIENQENLSNETKLAPAILQGETYDSLTNTARFMAYSNESGPVPDLATLAFTTKEQHHKLAETIRNYCKK